MGGRIVIIGNAGGGKSTLANQLSQAKNLPLDRLDALQWNPGWIRTSEAEFDRRQVNSYRETKWVSHVQSPRELRRLIEAQCATS